MTEKRVHLQKRRKRKEGWRKCRIRDKNLSSQKHHTNSPYAIYPLVLQKPETDETDNGKTCIRAHILTGGLC